MGSSPRIRWEPLRARAHRVRQPLVRRRRPRPGIIFHTDRGIDYAAYAFRGRLAALGFVQSMNRPGEIADNADMESFFHSMKTDVVRGFSFATDEALDRQLRSYICTTTGYACTRARYCSPIDYERRAA